MEVEDAVEGDEVAAGKADMPDAAASKSNSCATRCCQNKSFASSSMATSVDDAFAGMGNCDALRLRTRCLPDRKNAGEAEGTTGDAKYGDAWVVLVVVEGSGWNEMEAPDEEAE